MCSVPTIFCGLTNVGIFFNMPAPCNKQTLRTLVTPIFSPFLMLGVLNNIRYPIFLLVNEHEQATLTLFLM